MEDNGCEFDDSKILDVLEEIQQSLRNLSSKLARIQDTVDTIAAGR